MITKEQIERFDSILARGLKGGAGTIDGQMCIEQAVCVALDLPFSDNPECVAESVRSYKIRLNDSRWSSPEARAKGLRDLGIAQIGSKGVVNDKEFVTRLAEKTIRILIPKFFRDWKGSTPKMLEAADRCEKEGTKDAASAAASAASAAASAADAAASAAYAAYAAASAAADAAYAAYAAAYAASAADAAKSDELLLLSARLALEILRELKSPGCEYL